MNVLYPFRSMEALLTIINDILDFSKVEAGKLELESLDFDLDRVISDIGKIMSNSARSKGLEFRVESPGHLDRLLRGDAGRLRQVLLNLLSNAVKFTEAGKVSLCARILDETEDQVRLTFKVEDSGLGIPKEALSRLFTPFTQADTSTTRRFGGTGLGLSISKRLVELMGGTIEVQSTPGKGSSFWFTLAFPKTKPRTATVSYARLPSKNIAPTNKTILVAEDNLVNQKVALGLLEMLGYHAVAVGNGKEALAILSRQKFDLILMDCQMPELDGYETTARIRADASSTFHKIPIVAMTANVIKGDIARCLAAGMDDYVSKPIYPEALLATLEKWLRPDRAGVINMTKIDEIRSWAKGKQEHLLHDLFESFVATVPIALEKMQDAFRRNDIPTLKAQAHATKSAARHLGADNLAALCQKLEDLTSSSDLTQARDCLAEMERELAGVLESLKTIIMGSSGGKAA